ncbi:MAG: zinc-dependent metalloprotease [Flavobacteriaceae bacterium]
MNLFNTLGKLTLVFLFTVSASFAQSDTKKDSTESKGGLKAFDKVIKADAISKEGLFTVHQMDSKYYFEIPDSLFQREMLIVTRIAKTATNMGFGGGKQNTQVVRWERRPKQVLLRVVSYENVAADSLAIHEAVVNSNFEPVLFAFDVETVGEDSSNPTTVINVTKLFTDDVKAIGIAENYREEYKVRALDGKRSYIESIKPYPLNVEVRAVMTYNAAEPPSNQSVGSISVEISNSMILLPKEPMKRRYFDERVGWFGRSQTDYGLEAQKSEVVRYLDRWRLEVKDEDREKFLAGELVEPKKQIIYYVDRATPEKWVPYIKAGIEDWQVAFEAAGFKNAIIAMDPPTVEEDPDWSPEDVRYSVVRYLASPIPNANGPHVSDPRSGEILESDINWYHNVMTLLRNWYFVQTAAINPEAQSVAFKDEIMGRLIRFVSSHEVGHTLGLPHNMGSSVAYPVDSLRSAEFTQKYGTAPSIMDYARFNYVAQPGDEGVSMMPNVGPYDKYSINWGYRPIFDVSATGEKPILDQWILEKAGDPIYRFGAQQWSVIDPSSQTEDLGANAVDASQYGIMNLKRIVPRLIDWTGGDGKNYDDLDELYGQVVGQFNRYMGHVAANVGGVYKYTKTYDQEGAVFTHVDKAHQERCVRFLQSELFTTPNWLLDANIFNKIESTGALTRIRDMQVRTLNSLLSANRLERMIENEALNGSAAYTPMDFMDQVTDGLWRESTPDAYRRNLQRAHVDRLESLLKENDSDVRALAMMQLKKVQKFASKKYGGNSMSAAHFQEIEARISSTLE